MVWKGFSFRWYGELFRNEQILEAFMISIKIASLSATFATLLGVMIGYSLVRIPKIPARPFFIFLSSSPLVEEAQPLIADYVGRFLQESLLK